MKNQKQILEEIKRCASDDLKEKITEIETKENHTLQQTKAIMEAWNGLLFWRRTEVELMVKEYETT